MDIKSVAWIHFTDQVTLIAGNRRKKKKNNPVQANTLSNSLSVLFYFKQLSEHIYESNHILVIQCESQCLSFTGKFWPYAVDTI